MKFIIQSRTYDVQDAAKASLNVWRRVLLAEGVGMRTIMDDLKRISSMDDIFNDLQLQKSWMCLIWVLRLAAGEDVDFVQANDFPLTDFQLVTEDEAADPKAPTDSAQDAAPQA